MNLIRRKRVDSLVTGGCISDECDENASVVRRNGKGINIDVRASGADNHGLGQGRQLHEFSPTESVYMYGIPSP
jgi:hypothetical protein